MSGLQTFCLQRMDELKKIIKMAEEDIKSAPSGSLHISYKGSKVQYYWQNDDQDKTRRYIKRSEELLAKQLAQKEYAYKMMIMAMKDTKSLEKLLKINKQEDYTFCYSGMVGAKRDLINPYVLTDEEFRVRWEERKRNEILRQKLNETKLLEDEDAIVTEKGEVVRSKSEKILADKLAIMNVPYLYELPLYLNGYGSIKPDFTVLNIRTRKEFYWEHLGLMSDDDYCEKAVKKIECYEKNGIFPGRQLILTYETKNHPLNCKVVESLVKEYLL